MQPAPTKTTVETRQPGSPLVDALKTYDRQNRRRFHVPAHAGQCLYEDSTIWNQPFRYDLTELDGLDVLSEPDGAISEAQQRMASLFGVAHSFMLINGASVGLMAAMLCVAQPGAKVLIPRNAHRAVLSGLIVSGAEPVWFLPSHLPQWDLWGSVTVEQVQTQLVLHSDATALFLTSPTYEGLGSDIPAIARLCKVHGVALVVDEAHGSLWPLSEQLPVSACHSGADVVIHSLHKSGGSLTQSALAHLTKDSCVDPTLFQQALNTLQSTSPSYLLMASLDAACDFLGSTAGQTRIEWLLSQVQLLRRTLQTSLSQIKLYQPQGTAAQFWDPCKFYLSHPLQTGEDWGARVEETHQLAYESAKPGGVLYLANLGLTEADFAAFQAILMAEDEALCAAERPPAPLWEEAIDSAEVCLPQMALFPREAFFRKGHKVPITAALHRIAKETVVHCPPGIPVLMPGERIQKAHLPLLPEAGVWVVAEP
ncbi:aminotransferase class I/II-fold pyridoxal phosphate-dependent enzyme [Vampirovibrio chlorellavorus]|uniref:aminotransferase class I/II-fold pyridoxal phosphate-dependent enzyme n=1 Tax=Vampirovibrio chlorellavorus TaxID=758823 RepID=UPI0026EA555B|nr:aminotransferase class I/II-fold pyridoxal phosphate-dependent enzyme [Vampirovibrio chlorellavorus]